MTITRMDLGMNRKLDISKYPRVSIDLDGYQNKMVIVYKQYLNIVKFSHEKNGIFDKTHISEYLASKLAHKIGIPCQEVELGVYEGSDVCICKYVTKPDEDLHCYKDINDSSLSPQRNVKSNGYTIDEVREVLKDYKHSKDDYIKTLNIFYLMTAFDALIGNADRHWGNWGYIGKNKSYVGLAPLYDNGNSMCTVLTDRKMKKALRLTDNDFKDLFVLKLPNSQLKIDKAKRPFADIINHIDLEPYFGIIKSNLTTDDIRKIISEPKLKLYCSNEWLEFLERFLTERYKYFIGGERDVGR